MSLEQFNTIEVTDFIGSGDQEILGLLTQLNQELKAIGKDEIANNGEIAIAKDSTVKANLPKKILIKNESRYSQKDTITEHKYKWGVFQKCC